MLLVLKFLLNAAALVLVARLFSGIHLEGYLPALVAVLVLALVNTLVKPILFLLTLPLTLLTLGLFLFILNALMFKLAAALVPGFSVHGVWAAIGGAALYSIFTMLINWVFGW